MRVEHQQADARNCRHVGGTPRIAQHRDLAEEMPDVEPDPLVGELDLDLTGGNEIHRMRRVPAAHDQAAGLDLLRA